MFSSRNKPRNDLNASVVRFTDMTRDCFSRVKHLRILLENLSLHEKRGLIEEHAFATFHLVDELLLSCDVSSSQQGVIEAESGLWTLEQVLCLAPELVGTGWQRHAIESFLKKAIYPQNVLSVRKIAIRLFLIFYQSLAVYGKAGPELDRVFQCLLPHFPLRSGESTEMILQEYCQSAGNSQWISARGHVQPRANENQSNARERAQLLQVYLDKFLDYCARESTRIDWNDDRKKLECANFIIDKIITLYIHETFSDIEATGVDIFNGWMGGDCEKVQMDTADPVVIARYWLIRWMNNIASATQMPKETTHPSIHLFHTALFSSHRATNTLLSLMAEAMHLPLACSNVTIKVISLLSSWLLQKEIPPFVVSGEVSVDAASLHFIHTLLSFFHSPYIDSAGDRVKTALNTAFDILRVCNDVGTGADGLQRPLTVTVTNELLSRLAECGTRLSSLSDSFSQEVAGPVASTLLNLVVYTVSIRGRPVEESVWDECHVLLETSIWLQSAVQWQKVLSSVTRALILNLIDVDISTAEEQRKTVPHVRRLREKAADEGTATEETPSEIDAEDCVFVETDVISPKVKKKGTVEDGAVWLTTWRRFCLLLSPSASPSGKLAASTLSQTAVTLFTVGLDILGIWLVETLLRAPSAVHLQCVEAFVACLNSSRPSPILHSSCLVALSGLLPSTESSLLSSLLSLRPLHLSLLSTPLLSAIPRAVSSPPDELVLLTAHLSLSHTAAEQTLLRLLAGSDISPKQAALCTSALCVVGVTRGEVSLAGRVLTALLSARASGRLLHLFSSSVVLLSRNGHHSQVMEMLLNALQQMGDGAMRGEVEALAVSQAMAHPPSPIHLKCLLSLLSHDSQWVLLGALVSHCGQFPLPGFTVGQTTSILHQHSSTSNPEVFIHRKGALLSAGVGGEVVSRTRHSRRAWSMAPLPKVKAPSTKVSAWLQKMAAKPRQNKESSSILGVMGDCLELLGHPSPRPSPLHSSHLVTLIRSSKRKPRKTVPVKPMEMEGGVVDSRASQRECRSMGVSLGLVEDVCQTPSSFSRHIKHVDALPSRERHKVAVVYVAPGQEDKHSILSLSCASPSFDAFVDGLGWEVVVGQEEGAYAGGLPSDSPALYYSSPETEAIFHVSTRMEGDVARKLKHIGNDEVHIVWNEHWRPYRRETIATQFCDVLLVVERVSASWVRVRVQTQSPVDVSPLWDGIVIAEEEAPSLLRAAAFNASRAYRISRQIARPVVHRQEAWEKETTSLLKVPLAEGISRLYLPSMAESF